MSAANLGSSAQAPPADTHLVLASEIPSTAATCYLLQAWPLTPPMPIRFYRLRTDVSWYASPSTGLLFVDDPTMGAALAAPPSASAGTVRAGPVLGDGPPVPGGVGGGGGGSKAPASPKLRHPLGFNWGDLWLEALLDTNTAYVDVVVHGANNVGILYQLESKTVLNSPHLVAWTLGPVWAGDGTTNDVWFTNSCTTPPANFFRVVSGTVEAWLLPDSPRSQGSLASQTALRPAGTNGAVTRSFDIGVYYPPPLTSPIVYYSISGTATNGTDYDYLPGFIVLTNGASQTITVRPHYRANLGFNPIAVFTLAPTNGFVADPNNATVSVPIMDQFPTNPLPIVASPNQAVDVDYSVTEGSLLLSVNYPLGYYGSVGNFELLGTSGIPTPWASGVSGVPYEVNMATVKVSTNGFSAGDAYFIAEETGTVGWVRADGSAFNANWLTLPGETDPDETSDLYVDQAGLWGNNLLAVTSREAVAQSDVWSISISNSQPVATMIVSNLPTGRAEGLLTLPADGATYGPLAGTLVVGDELTNRIFAISRNGFVGSLSLGFPGFGLGGQTFLIVTNQSFYCQDSANPGQSYIRKLSPSLLQDHLGDILVLQCPESSPFLQPPTLWLLRWNGVNFDTWCLIFTDLSPDVLNFSPGFTFVEKGVFAPLDIPPSQ